MSASSGLAVFCLCAVACRAGPIAADQRYPAGTSFQTEYRVVDGTRLRIIDAGPRGGVPVVFIHGFGASLYSWRHTLPPVVAAGYRAIAFDNRGFGFSGKPAHGYTNAAYARLVTALLDSLGVSSAVLVGHSMGGAIAAEVTLAQPDRVSGLVLIDAAGFGVRWPGVLKLARWPVAGAVATSLRGRWITGRLLRSTYADAGKVTEADVSQYYAPVPDAEYGRALRGVLREFRFDSLVGRLGRIEAPTLVLWGAEDRWIPLRDGSRMAGELPRVAFITIPRAGHAAAEEASADVNPILLAYLKHGLPRIPESLARR
jgi:pimeloyl-ACP methyl ester carboxylesterase